MTPEYRNEENEGGFVMLEAFCIGPGCDALLAWVEDGVWKCEVDFDVHGVFVAPVADTAHHKCLNCENVYDLGAPEVR